MDSALATTRWKYELGLLGILDAIVTALTAYQRHPTLPSSIQRRGQHLTLCLPHVPDRNPANWPSNGMFPALAPRDYLPREAPKWLGVDCLIVKEMSKSGQGIVKMEQIPHCGASVRE